MATFTPTSPGTSNTFNPTGQGSSVVFTPNGTNTINAFKTVGQERYDGTFGQYRYKSIVPVRFGQINWGFGGVNNERFVPQASSQGIFIPS